MNYKISHGNTQNILKSKRSSCTKKLKANQADVTMLQRCVLNISYNRENLITYTLKLNEKSMPRNINISNTVSRYILMSTHV